MKINDLLLIASLRKNARETLTNMSKRVGMPVSTIFDKLKVFKGNEIKKHTSLIDFSKLGFGTRAVMILKARKNEREKLKGFLEKSHHINSISRINNGYDFIVDVIFKNLKELEEFGEKLEEKYKIKSKQNFYIIEDIKREDFLSDPEHVKLLENS
ncbi:MAG: Lrp/AsnC family transcriptional regulator [Nanoarchaeota archaeon]